MSTTSKPSIVFCHGLWADGSCFGKVIPTLQADGHEVIAVQYGLNNYADDVAKRSVLAHTRELVTPKSRASRPKYKCVQAQEPSILGSDRAGPPIANFISGGGPTPGAPAAEQRRST
jgi:hypothetical protein